MVFYHLIMQMIPGTYPGASHEPDHVPLFHLRTFPGVNECQMCVSGLKSETVRNDYRFPYPGVSPANVTVPLAAACTVAAYTAAISRPA